MLCIINRLWRTLMMRISPIVCTFVHGKTIDLPYCDRHHMPITNTIFAGQLIIIDFDANSILIQPLDDLRLQHSSDLDIFYRIWTIFFHVLWHYRIRIVLLFGAATLGDELAAWARWEVAQKVCQFGRGWWNMLGLLSYRSNMRDRLQRA